MKPGILTYSKEDLTIADQWFKEEGHKVLHKASPKKNAPIKTPSAAPIIIEIKNTTSGDINNVTIYNAYQDYQAGIKGVVPFISYFNQPFGIVIVSQIPNASYQQMLANSWGKPMKIGRTVIISKNTALAESIFTISHKTDYGQSKEHTATPFIDPYQKQSSRVIEDYEYNLDGFTKITCAVIPALSKMTIRLYPAARFNPTSLVEDGNGKLQWKKPKLIRPLFGMIEDFDDGLGVLNWSKPNLIRPAQRES
jgi:hypothetical protein